jgi:hypothetical protein
LKRTAEWVERQRQLAAAERWVMDGNDASTLALRLQRADMVVLCGRLTPTHPCLT